MSGFANLCEIVAQLRGAGGCPWDREQTNESLVPPLIEEAYEVAEAVWSKDDENLREELGDLLLLIVMHAQIAAELKRFSIEDVMRGVCEKLVRRHPHVFGSKKLVASDAVTKQWEAIKREEKSSQLPYLGTVPKALPALMRAEKVQKKVARVNFDWANLRQVVSKVDEELGEAKNAIAFGIAPAIADEIGDLLFAVVNLARKCNADAESLLQGATDKFITRFNEVEARLRERGGKLGDANLQELDTIWNEIKAERR